MFFGLSARFVIMTGSDSTSNGMHVGHRDLSGRINRSEGGSRYRRVYCVIGVVELSDDVLNCADSRMPGAGSRVSTVSAYDAADHADAYNRVEVQRVHMRVWVGRVGIPLPYALIRVPRCAD